jgi:hypothetical protein
MQYGDRSDKVKTVPEKSVGSVDLPLSDESKRALTFTEEEANQLSSKHIGTDTCYLACFGNKIVLLQRYCMSVAFASGQFAKS